MKFLLIYICLGLTAVINSYSTDDDGLYKVITLEISSRVERRQTAPIEDYHKDDISILNFIKSILNSIYNSGKLNPKIEKPDKPIQIEKHEISDSSIGNHLIQDPKRNKSKSPKLFGNKHGDSKPNAIKLKSINEHHEPIHNIEEHSKPKSYHDELHEPIHNIEKHKKSNLKKENNGTSLWNSLKSYLIPINSQDKHLEPVHNIDEHSKPKSYHDENHEQVPSAKTHSKPNSYLDEHHEQIPKAEKNFQTLKPIKDDRHLDDPFKLNITLFIKDDDELLVHKKPMISNIELESSDSNCWFCFGNSTKTSTGVNGNCRKSVGHFIGGLFNCVLNPILCLQNSYYNNYQQRL